MIQDFPAGALLAWFDGRRRPFPWRTDPTPYRIWVSEIMLQQTRIEAALPYFERFMTALPTVGALADAPEDMLHKLWEGLGYYSRVRNLQKAAAVLVRDYGGALPASYDALLALPGIGEYTAGAIASIAFGLPVPAVDGNVLRVAARLTNDDGDVLSTPVKKRLRDAVTDWLPADAPGAFNEAVMELGETVCLPNTAPVCGDCPLAACCEGRAAGRAADLPVRAAKKARRVERRTVFVILAGGCVLLRRRPTSGLLAGLWELPSVEGWREDAGGRWDADAAAAAGLPPGAAVKLEPLPDARHLFSHVEWQMRACAVRTEPFPAPDGGLWADRDALRLRVALPSAFKVYTKWIHDAI